MNVILVEFVGILDTQYDNHKSTKLRLPCINTIEIKINGINITPIADKYLR